MSEVRLACANKALLAVPAWESHERGSNWLAVIDINGLLPGGLSRQWMPRAKGECFYLVSDLALFDAVEFGADYTTGVGKKKQCRWYGVVIAKTEDHLVLEETASGVEAVMLAKSHRTDPEHRAAALRAERQSILDHAEKLRREADSIAVPWKQSGPSKGTAAKNNAIAPPPPFGGGGGCGAAVARVRAALAASYHDVAVLAAHATEAVARTIVDRYTMNGANGGRLAVDDVCAVIAQFATFNAFKAKRNEMVPPPASLLRFLYAEIRNASPGCAKTITAKLAETKFIPAKGQRQNAKTRPAKEA